jgi:hypothetical protein
MRGTCLVATIFTIAIGWAQLDLHAQHSAGNFSPNDQLVVLKNGEILRGQVSRNAQQVIVVTAQGSRLVLAADRTEFVCNSMDEAYWGKCARIKATDLRGQQKLFHWCLKNKLLDFAQNQIDVLLQSEIKASQLEYLDRQLNVAIIQQTKARERLAKTEKLAETKVNPASSVAQSTGDPIGPTTLAPIDLDTTIGKVEFDSNLIDTTVFRPLPSLTHLTDRLETELVELPPLLPNDSQATQNAVRQVGFEEEIEYDTVSLDHRKQNLTQSEENQESKESQQSQESPLTSQLRDDRVAIPIPQLEKLTRSMPTGSLGHYRQRVERVLTHNCGKCHDSDSRTMPLMQVGRMQAIPRRQSQRNLHNVLRYVDRQRPMESPLLIAASKPHAGAENPILKPGTEHYQNLMLWLIMLSDDPQAAAFQAMASPLESTLGDSADEETPAPINGVVPVKPEPAGLMPLDDMSDKFPVTIGEIPKLNSPDNEFTPMDPFDPEIFNRKYGGN